jgi:membrane protease YdiL (CAAX protease family)
MNDPSPVPSNLDPSQTSALPPQPSKIRAIFVGPQGIRAGWRLLMYIAMMLMVGLALSFIFQRRSHNHLWDFFFGELFGVIAVIIPAFIMARIEKRPFGAYGLPAQGAFGKLFWNGALWGVVAITLLLGILRGLHGFYFGHLALHGIRLLKFALFWGVVFLLVGFFEEFLLRGYTQFTLASGIGFWPAAVLLSTAFGALHLGNKGESPLGALAAGLIGLFFCLTLQRTGNLWFAVGFHMSFDWGETFLYSVPNSGTVEPGHLLNSSFQGPTWLTGGTVGPEGSVFVFLVIALAWIAFDRMYKKEVKYST